MLFTASPGPEGPVLRSNPRLLDSFCTLPGLLLPVFFRIALDAGSLPLDGGIALVFLSISRGAAMSVRPVLFLLAEGIVLFLPSLLCLLVRLELRVLFGGHQFILP